ncbi:Folylpolyglutamate synthetase [Naganishia albida]|nr:Folylpolyglutamate synthetase [Naganishia albida]
MSGSESPAGKTYRDAINLLNTCQSNAATIEAIRKSGMKMNQYAIPEMVEYLHRIGHKPEDLNALNVIHITGTKGKGSTSAFVERICRERFIQAGYFGDGGVSKLRNKEEEGDDDVVSGGDEEWYGGIGLYTSPHLCAVRERIRINGKPIPEHLFAKFFFQVWDRLDAYRTTSTTSPSGLSEEHLEHLARHPVYFRFLTLLAFHTFIQTKTRLTVLEVGMGGTYDSTNVVPKPLACGVTALGLDHTFMLGDTIEEIAKNKAGIYKRGVRCYSVVQEGRKGEKELREAAEHVGAASFDLVPIDPKLQSVKLGLPGKHQIINASLAVALTRGVFTSPSLPSTLSRLAEPSDTAEPSGTVPDAYLPFLERTRWPGRCQTVRRDGISWFLDGAHTVESLTCCGDWAFGADGMSKERKGKRVLIFNCTSGRSGHGLLKALLDAGRRALGADDEDAMGRWFDKVVFCTNVTYTDGGFKGDLTSKAIDPNDLSALATQHQLEEAWSSLVPSFPKEDIHVVPSIEHAVRLVRTEQKSGEVEVLVAGSLHLVGGVMEVAGLAEQAIDMA